MAKIKTTAGSRFTHGGGQTYDIEMVHFADENLTDEQFTYKKGTEHHIYTVNRACRALVKAGYDVVDEYDNDISNLY